LAVGFFGLVWTGCELRESPVEVALLGQARGQLRGSPVVFGRALGVAIEFE